MPVVKLPRADGALEAYKFRGPATWRTANGHGLDRIALAAAHVVADPLVDNDPWVTPAIDWDATIAFRRHLWSLGLGVAEAMDTAQRGMGLDWPATQPAPETSQKSRLPAVPTLILAGDHDLSTPLEWAQEEAASAPLAKLVIVHGAAHSIQTREPGEDAGFRQDAASS